LSTLTLARVGKRPDSGLKEKLARRRALNPCVSLFRPELFTDGGRTEIQTLSRLAEIFTVIADAYPLKRGIRHDILADDRTKGLSRTSLRKALVVHTGSPRYLKSVIAEDFRRDLDNEITANRVTVSEKEYSRDQLAQLNTNKLAAIARLESVGEES
jgi:hypothetical protein